jgi:hypothetical protein
MGFSDKQIFTRQDALKLKQTLEKEFDLVMITDLFDESLELLRQSLFGKEEDMIYTLPRPLKVRI